MGNGQRYLQNHRAQGGFSRHYRFYRFRLQSGFRAAPHERIEQRAGQVYLICDAEGQKQPAVLRFIQPEAGQKELRFPGDNRI